MGEWLKRYWPVLGLLALGGATVGAVAVVSRGRPMESSRTMGQLSGCSCRDDYLRAVRAAQSFAERGHQRYGRESAVAQMLRVANANWHIGAAAAMGVICEDVDKTGPEYGAAREIVKAYELDVGSRLRALSGG